MSDDDIDDYLQSLSNATVELQPVLDVAELARTVTELKKLRSKHDDRFEADVRQLIGWCNVRMRELKAKSRDALNAGYSEEANIFLAGIDAIARGPKALAMQILAESEARLPLLPIVRFEDTVTGIPRLSDLDGPIVMTPRKD